ncbi:centromere protein X-like [Patiria miniata]|uniref:Centromere protein X n=1 Tax=Patiria miniata TaxID=46514 RepID=A0A914ALB3_PATMI|nr:centromere protein X-like [Patiria miniata]
MADDRSGASFKVETVQKLLQSTFQDDKTKISKDAVRLMVEMLRVFAAEGAARAAQQAKSESGTVVEPRHFEKVLPQLLLDF